jgi:hypothetical protein
MKKLNRYESFKTLHNTYRFNGLFWTPSSTVNNRMNPNHCCRYSLGFTKICLFIHILKTILKSKSIHLQHHNKTFTGKQKKRVKTAHIDNSGTPITKEVSRSRSWSKKAPNIITFIKGSSNNLPA